MHLPGCRTLARLQDTCQAAGTSLWDFTSGQTKLGFIPHSIFTRFNLSVTCVKEGLAVYQTWFVGWLTSAIRQTVVDCVNG